MPTAPVPRVMVSGQPVATIAAPYAVAAYIGAAYFFTSSTSFVQHAYSSLYDATAVAANFVATNSNLDQAGRDLGIYSEVARIHRLGQDVVITSKLKSSADGEAVFECEAVQGASKLVRRGRAVLKTA